MVAVCFRSTFISSLVIYAFMCVQMGGAKAGHALHASSYQIQQLWEDEERTIEIIQTLLKSLTRLTDVFNRYVASWKALSDGREREERSGDPAAIYRLLRHVAGGWREVDDVLTETKDIFSRLEHLSTRADREKLPNNDDVSLTAEALAKLAHIYHFNPTSLAEGIIRSETEVGGWDSREKRNSTFRHLSVDELVSIGVVAMNKGYFGVGVDFMRAAKIKASSASLTTSYSEYSLNHIEGLLRTAVKVHNHVLEVRGPRSLTHATSSSRFENTGLRVQFRDRRKQIEGEDDVIISEKYLSRHDNRTWMLNQRSLVELDQVERLCRGEDLREINTRSSLSCRYLNSGSSWLLLAPFKMEVVSLDPYIAVIYEVITPNESTTIKAAAQKSLHTPLHQQGIEKEGASVEDWSLKHVWLEGKSHEPLQRLSRRLSKIANVNIYDHSSEPFMVANYGIGGEYKSHRDTYGPSRTPPNEGIGERFATIVTYLEAPLDGGRLVFPWVGVSIQAVSRAAVIWWNLLASQEHDFLTVHAACPILSGHKWIANKWIGYKSQWNTHPCPIDPSKKTALSR